MAKPTHDIVATTGEYTNRAGEKKKRYVTCGKAFTDEQGRVSLKIEALPVGLNWSGWLSLYPVENQAPRQQPDPRPKSATPAPAEDFKEEDDIPF